MSNGQLDPSAEVVHLRRLLDIQPGCLMRLAGDGVVLAANDAALMLLGVPSGQQALGRAFAAWIPPDQRDRWHGFAVQVIAGSPASIECDIIDASGQHQTALFHGVPLTNHPDGLTSMAVTARVVSGQRQLEAALVEREAALRELEAEGQEARAKLEDARARERQLEGTLHALETRFRAELEELAAQHQQVKTARIVERQRVLELLDSIAVQHRQELITAQGAHERHLVPPAVASGTARDIASRLRQHLDRVDDFATGMLTSAAIDSSMRPALAQLRRETAQASALADQLLTDVEGRQPAKSADRPLVSGDERRS